MEVFLLLGFGVLFAVIYLLLSLIRALVRVQKIKFTDLLLAFLVTILFLAALIVNAQAPTPATLPPLPANAPPLPPAVAGILQTLTIELAVRYLAAGFALGCIVILLVELTRPQRWKGSRGLLGLWAALLISVSTFTVPLINVVMSITPPPPAQVAGNVVGGATEEATADPNEPPTATPTPSRTPTPTITRTPTLTRTPRPTASETATRYLFATRTPEPSPTLANPCVATTLYNLRLRTAPNADAETLLTIPYDTSVPVFARNADSTWWFTNYEDQQGWVDGQYLQTTNACNNLPVREAE